MKISASLVLAPAAVAAANPFKQTPIPQCGNGKKYQSTTTRFSDVGVVGTTVKTVPPSTVKTIAVPTLITTTTSLKSKLTITKPTTSTSLKVIKTTTTSTKTITDSADAVYITPDPTTTTIASDDGFTPAASALITASAGNQRRAAKPKFDGTLCVTTLPHTTTTSTKTATTTVGKTTTITTTSLVKSFTTSTVYLGGTTTVFSVNVIPKTTTSTFSAYAEATIIPTITLSPETVEIYEACMDLNLLGYTFPTTSAPAPADSGSASTDSTTDSTDTATATDTASPTDAGSAATTTTDAHSAATTTPDAGSAPTTSTDGGSSASTTTATDGSLPSDDPAASSSGDDSVQSNSNARAKFAVSVSASKFRLRRNVLSRLFRAKRQTNQIGINSVTATDGVNVVADTTIFDDAAVDATDCCVHCQKADGCAGSYYTASEGNCFLLITDTCSSGQASGLAGSFYYDQDNTLDVDAGDIVSNGKCGTWSSGGEQASS